MMSFLYGYILILSISLTIAVRLDGICTNDTECEGTGAICRGKCQCNTPFYKPCKSSCEVNRFAYVGEDCRVQGNCLGNTYCQENKCKCDQDYTEKNGVCFKNLNVTCINHTECWSQYCLNSRCECAPYYELSDDRMSCRRKLSKIYKNLVDALTDSASCSDDNSCIDPIAQCISDAANQPKYCKCPYGYTVTDDNQRCQAIQSQLVSPLNPSPSSYGECGYCKDNNAACMQAGSQTTCWCRSGYDKKGETCEEQRMKPLIIFPNSNDLTLHDFTNNCQTRYNGTNKISNKLCVCAPGYKFVAKDQPCVKIPSNWIDKVFEYGVCTRINSQDEAKPEHGLCPEPLKCEAQTDKHICTCGKDKFLDLDDPTQCVYYINSTTNAPDDKCPTNNAVRNSTTGICECLTGYKAINENRQCELKLSSEDFQSSCSSDRSNDKVCVDKFGIKALLCTVGECRCGNQSYSNSAETNCYAPVNQTLSPPMENCPPNSTRKTNQCECNDGYRPSNDKHQCVGLERIIKLGEYEGPSTNRNGNLTTKDCQVLFKGPVEANNAGDRCQCKIDTFKNDNDTGCWYKLGITLQQRNDSLFCPANSGPQSGQVCQCDLGYKINGNKCDFLINAYNDAIKGTRTCPANTTVSSTTPNTACICKPGFRVSPTNQTLCVLADIRPINAIDVSEPYTTNCVNFTDNDCSVYGEHAFCQNETCFCNRRLSFINADGKCESISKYIFPGEHERSNHSCNTDKDCGNEKNVICGYLSDTLEYKVCKCTDGSFLNPQSQKCEDKQCAVDCQTIPNSECRGYECVCKIGYYKNGRECSKIPYELKLDQPCNGSAFTEFSEDPATNNTLECSTDCDRAQCKFGYQPDQSQSRCVRYGLDKDKCVHQEHICKQINENSICNRDDNKCSCVPSYYPSGDSCARAVGSRCTTDEECGFDMICKGRRCDCNERQRKQEIRDIYGRPMYRCVNGIDRIRFNLILLLFVILARVFFI